MSSDTHSGEQLARALGFFSIGLGLTQILAPGSVTRLVGLEDHETNHKTMRAFGFREAAAGIGLLARPSDARFAWGRVAGDALDLAVLGRGLGSSGTDRTRLAAATTAVLGVTILDVIAGMTLGKESNGNGHRAAPAARRDRGIRVRKAITINRSPEEAYAFWRDFENLPRFMAHLESVRQLDDRLSYWRAKAPLGATAEWTAELVEDQPNKLLAWRSVEGSTIPNSGVVRFTPAPGGRGTEVHVDLSYDPPGGVIGATIAKLFGEEPSQQVNGDLRRFKQMLEVGEVVHSDASIHRGPHSAQPAESESRDLVHAGGAS
jgi:uncharacterized membrane protein